MEYYLDPESLAFNEKGIAVVEIDGRPICITRFNGKYYAFAQKCPHASAPLEDGFVDAAGNIACGVHKYRFNLKSGRDAACEGYYLKTYPVELRPDGMWIRL